MKKEAGIWLAVPQNRSTHAADVKGGNSFLFAKASLFSVCSKKLPMSRCWAILQHPPTVHFELTPVVKSAPARGGQSVVITVSSEGVHVQLCIFMHTYIYRYGYSKLNTVRQSSRWTTDGSLTMPCRSNGTTNIRGTS